MFHRETSAQENSRMADSAELVFIPKMEGLMEASKLQRYRSFLRWSGSLCVAIGLVGVVLFPASENLTVLISGGAMSLALIIIGFKLIRDNS